MSVCNCKSAIGNTGAPGCQTVADVAKKIILVPIKDSDGNFNEIDLDTDLVAGVLPDAFVQGKINESDPFARWYPTPDEFENLNPEVADPVTKEYDSGRTEIVQNGIESFEGVLVGFERQLAAQLNKAACVEFGVYIVTKDGDLEGSLANGNKLRPTRVLKGSFLAKYEPSTDTEPAEIRVTFNFSKLEKDENRRMLTADSIETDMTTLEGLIEIEGSVTPNITTELEFDAFGNWGDVANPYRLEGLVIADLNIPGAVISAVVETSVPGVYTVTHNAAAGAQTLELTKTGYYMEPIAFTNP